MMNLTKIEIEEEEFVSSADLVSELQVSQSRVGAVIGIVL